MPFFIEATTHPNMLEERAAHRPAHLAYLNDQLTKLLTVGPKLDDDGTPIGSIYILDVATRAEAEAFIAADPFTIAGLFADTRIVACGVSFLDRTSLV